MFYKYLCTEQAQLHPTLLCSVFFRPFFGNCKQIIAKIFSQRKILDELERNFAELGHDFGHFYLVFV